MVQTAHDIVRDTTNCFALILVKGCRTYNKYGVYFNLWFWQRNQHDMAPFASLAVVCITALSRAWN